MRDDGGGTAQNQGGGDKREGLMVEDGGAIHPSPGNHKAANVKGEM